MGIMLVLKLNYKLEKATWCLSLEVASSTKRAFSSKFRVKFDFGKNWNKNEM